MRPRKSMHLRRVMNDTATRVTNGYMIFDVGDDDTVTGVAGPSPSFLSKTDMAFYRSAVAHFRASLFRAEVR